MAIKKMNINASLIPDSRIREWYKEKTSNRFETVQPPTILQLEVTKNCNFACIMCHKGQSVHDGNDFLRSDLSEIARKQIKPVYPHLKQAMLFGDGEPMVYKNFWDIVADIREASPNCMIDFINNGSMMHNENRNKLFKYKISHLGLSIGGATEESHNFVRPPGMFNKIIKYYKSLYHEKQKLKTLEPYITALMVVVDKNYKEIPQLVELCSSLGFFSIELQKLFVTHSMVENQVVSDSSVEPYIHSAAELAKKLNIGFYHYKLSSGNNYYHNSTKLNANDIMFKKTWTEINNGGYCKFQQPWNTVYVLHDGKVVPDCHWWSSVRETQFNTCGILNENTNILDIWNGETYNNIRAWISNGKILPQCRGCGVTGGVVDSFRSLETDHTSPSQEQKFTKLNISAQKNKETNIQAIISGTILHAK